MNGGFVPTKFIYPSYRGKGLMLALIVESSDVATRVILECMQKGLILFWLLFEEKAIRITPPLTISKEEILKGCKRFGLFTKYHKVTPKPYE